jgi:hypothetical protein
MVVFSAILSYVRGIGSRISAFRPVKDKKCETLSEKISKLKKGWGCGLSGRVPA